MRRVPLALAAVAMLAVPTSILAVTLSSTPAGATTKLVCTKLTGSGGGTITIKKCNDTVVINGKVKADKNNKSMSGAATALVAGATGTLTWAPSGKTTVVHSLSAVASGQGPCKAKSMLYNATGEVTGGTSPYTSPGQRYSVKVCVTSNSKLKVSLAPGTNWTL
jgi:hypothetical protein